MAVSEETEALMLAYVYGELSASAALAFERQMDADPELRAEVEGMQAAHELFGKDQAWGLSAKVDAPPPHLLDAILKAEAIARAPQVKEAMFKRDAPSSSSSSFTAKMSRWLFGGGLVLATAGVLFVVTRTTHANMEAQLAAPQGAPALTEATKSLAPPAVPSTATPIAPAEAQDNKLAAPELAPPVADGNKAEAPKPTDALADEEAPRPDPGAGRAALDDGDVAGDTGGLVARDALGLALRGGGADGGDRAFAANDKSERQVQGAEGGGRRANEADDDSLDARKDAMKNAKDAAKAEAKEKAKESAKERAVAKREAVAQKAAPPKDVGYDSYYRSSKGGEKADVANDEGDRSAGKKADKKPSASTKSAESAPAPERAASRAGPSSSPAPAPPPPPPPRSPSKKSKVADEKSGGGGGLGYGTSARSNADAPVAAAPELEAPPPSVQLSLGSSSSMTTTASPSPTGGAASGATSSGVLAQAQPGEVVSPEELRNKRAHLLEKRQQRERGEEKKVDAARQKRTEAATLAFNTGELEYQQKSYASSLDAMLEAEHIDTDGALGAAPLAGQMKALLALKRAAEASRIARRTVNRNIKTPAVADAWIIGAQAAEETGDLTLARDLWTRLLDVPAHRDEARRAVARLRGGAGAAPAPLRAKAAAPAPAMDFDAESSGQRPAAAESTTKQ